MSTIRKAGIVIKPHAPRIESALSDLGAYFDRRGVSYILEEAAAEKLGRPGGLPRPKIPEQCDLVVVLGGDGTLLSIAHIAARHGVPVMGVNLGSLGFLTEVTLPEMALALDALLDGAPGVISRRLMLEAIFKGESNLCLNDIVINKGAVARMIHMKIWLDHKELETMRGDGLIIATPTGSTAYSLAAGGPILHPAVPAVLLTPICPHTLTFRPIVISSEIPIRIELLTSGEEVFLTFDGQRGGTMVEGDLVEVRRAKHALELVSSPKRNYFGLLSEKFSWGG